MTAYQRHSFQYPSLRITVKPETEERSVTEIYSNPRVYSFNHHPTTVYYNSNHRQKQYFNRPSTVQRRSQKCDRFQPPQPLRPLMEIQNNRFDVPYGHDLPYSYTFIPKPPRQHGKYRNRKAELDWDHAFDLDQIDLYTIQNDIDNRSLTSLSSSIDNSFSSV